MKRLVTLVALVLVLSPAAKAQDATLDSDYKKFSYAMGFRMARELMQQGITDVDPSAVVVGVAEAMKGEPFRYSQQEFQAILAAYQESLVTKRTEQAMANKDAGDRFLQENAGKEGVQALTDGVQYKILKEGNGEKPAADAQVKVHYTGTLIDGTQFDSSRSRGEPTVLGLGSVIPGWRLALAQMPVGSRWMVWIPPEQGYGLRGAGAHIGPNATLVFDIELLEVVKAQ